MTYGGAYFRTRCRKRAFRSPAKAKRAAREGRGVRLYIYRCPHCGSYHLTKQKQ